MGTRGPKKVEPGNRVPLPVFMYDRHYAMLDELDLTIANSRSYAIRTLIEQAWNAQKRRYQRLARERNGGD